MRLSLSPLIACLLVALVLRLAFVFLGFPWLETRWNLKEDGDHYGEIAQSIRAGQYDDVTRGPIYPLIVAMAGLPLVVKISQALLDTATCALIYSLAGNNWRAAILWAVYPLAIWRVAFINKEVVLTFLLVSYAFIQLAAFRDMTLKRWALAGIFLGLLNLCKPTFLLWPLLVLYFGTKSIIRSPTALAANEHGHRPILRLAMLHTGALISGMILVIAPWTWRNHRITGGEFLPVGTERGGLTTFIGNYQPTLGLWEGDAIKSQWQSASEEIERKNKGASVVQLDRVFYHAAWNHVLSNPSKAVELGFRKCWRFWFSSAKQRERTISMMIQMVYLALAVTGLWRLRPWNVNTWMMLALILYVMCVHALTYADLRFSIIVMPFVCIFGAAVSDMLQKKKEWILPGLR